MASTAFRTSMVRWLLVPAVVGLLAMLGMATSSEGRDEFQAGLTDSARSGAPSDDTTQSTAGESAQPSPSPSASAGTAPTVPPPATPETTIDPSAASETDTVPAENDPGAEGGDDEPDPGVDPGRLGEAEQVSFEVHADAGSVAVRLGTEPDGSSLAIPRSVDGAPGTTHPLGHSDGSDSADLQRLSVSGGLEPLGNAPIGVGEFALGGVVGGVDLLTADGTRIEFRLPATETSGGESTSGGDAGGAAGRAAGRGDFTITGIDPGGLAGPISPDENGLIDLGNGVQVQVQVEPPPPSIWVTATTTRWRWFVLANLVLVIVSLAVAYYLHRVRPIEVVEPDFAASSTGGVERFEDFLEELLTDNDPARAIRLAFETAERGMGTLPARLATETPFEWHSRVAATQRWFADDLSSLCSRFATARFAPDRPTSLDRDAAVAELQSLAVLAGYRPSVIGSSPVLARLP